MMDSVDNKHKDNLEIRKTKAFFLGFIVGIIPFMILLSIISLKFGGIEYIPILFKNTISIAALVTSVINSFILKNMVN